MRLKLQIWIEEAITCLGLDRDLLDKVFANGDNKRGINLLDNGIDIDLGNNRINIVNNRQTKRP